MLWILTGKPDLSTVLAVCSALDLDCQARFLQETVYRVVHG